VSVIVNIADAVVTVLNDAASPLTGQAVAARHYQPVFDLQDMKDLHVTVVPRGVEMTSASRIQVQSDVQIDIGIQKKLTTDQLAEIDALMELVDQIAGYLRQRALAFSGGAAVWVRSENTPIYAPEHLDQLRQFTSVLTLTYRVMR